MSDPTPPKPSLRPASSSAIIARRIGLILLPLLFLAAIYGVFILGRHNGTFDYLESHTKAAIPHYPDSKQPLLRRYTGIRPIDEILRVLVAFFAPVVSGQDRGMSVFLLWGFGQFGAAWGLLVLESLRFGNWRWGTVSSYVGLYGVMFQIFSFGVTTPVFLFLQLLTSPLLGSHDLPVPSTELAMLPVSILLGFVLPTWLMTHPERLGAEIASPTHQRLIALWQAFPLWTVLILRVGKWLIDQFSDKSPRIQWAPSSIRREYLRAVKPVYILLFLLAFTTHLFALVRCTPFFEVLRGAWPSIAGVTSSSFSNAFIPRTPLVGPEYRYDTLMEGVHNLLMWDVYIGSLATLIWGTVVYKIAMAERSGSIGRKTETRRPLVLEMAAVSVVAGPMGALILLFWCRDLLAVSKTRAE
jgi:hypothetical protein